VGGWVGGGRGGYGSDLRARKVCEEDYSRYLRI